MILQAAARPMATPVAAYPLQPDRPCAIRTAPRRAAAVKVVRNVSTFQKWESWMPRTQKTDSPAASRLARRCVNRRVMRYTSHTVTRSKIPESARPMRYVPS